jgi:hypothetical protein
MTAMILVNNPKSGIAQEMHAMAEESYPTLLGGASL